MQTRSANQMMDKVISTSSYTISGATAAGGFFSLNDLALALGIFFALLTFVVNWLYQHRKHVMEIERAEQDRAFHEVRMKHMQKGLGDDYLFDIPEKPNE